MDDGIPRYSRRWFGEVALAAWSLMIVHAIAVGPLGWDPSGLLYAAGVGIALAVLAVSGIAWVLLAVRDVERRRRRWRAEHPALLALGTTVSVTGTALLVAIVLAA